MRWTDNHCHLPGGDLDRARALAADARTAGVERLINVGCDIDDSTEAIAVAAAVEGTWATVGVHPHEAHTLFRDEHRADDRYEQFETLLAEPRVVAVGECGLDYHYDHSPRAQQRAVFAEQIAMAHRHDLALVIHTREAWVDTFAILDTEGVPDRTVFHCFTGGPDEAERGLALGVLLSFSGIITYKNAPEVRDAARCCPLDHVLVETDAPYLAPVPKRGRRNEPANVTLVGAAVADAKGVAVEEVAAASWANAERLYRLPSASPPPPSG